MDQMKDTSVINGPSTSATDGPNTNFASEGVTTTAFEELFTSVSDGQSANVTDGLNISDFDGLITTSFEELLTSVSDGQSTSVTDGLNLSDFDGLMTTAFEGSNTHTFDELNTHTFDELNTHLTNNKVSTIPTPKETQTYNFSCPQTISPYTGPIEPLFSELFLPPTNTPAPNEYTRPMSTEDFLGTDVSFEAGPLTYEFKETETNGYPANDFLMNIFGGFPTDDGNTCEN
jgi:hypothetical protein